MFKTVQQCRKLYRDIVAGYSFVAWNNSYIKHLTDSDLGLLEDKGDLFLETAKKAGLQSESEALITLDKEGHWTKSEEENYQGLINEIKDLIDQRPKLAIKEQVEDINREIKEREDKLSELHKQRAELLSVTAESYSERKQQEEILKISYYKDSELKKLLYSVDEFDELGEPELRKLFVIFGGISVQFTDRNIQKVSVCPFFLNAYDLCNENASNFYGKPIYQLSSYQKILFTRGMTNSKILESEGSPPDGYYSDLDNVVNWFDARYQILVGKALAANRNRK